MNYTEFESKILKRNEKKFAKVRNSWGVYDAYKYIRKNGWFDIGKPIKEKDFYKIIRKVNDAIAQGICKGDSIVFPARMGRLDLRKFERGVSIVGGKLKITYPVDWSETLKLWYTNEEERKKKTLLRMENRYVYHVRYNKHDANYANKDFYEFVLNRKIKKTLKENINNGQVDTLW